MRYCGGTVLILLALLVPVLALAAGDDAARERANWLVHRGETQLAGFGGGVLQQTGVGNDGFSGTSSSVGSKSALLPVLMSAILPGAGETYLGYHKRGIAMMAIDIAAWIGASSYNQKGQDTRDEYYAYADAHWDEQRLVEAYNPSSSNEELAGIGNEFFQSVYPVTEAADFEREDGGLPLWVSVVDDRREYYENLGKWDQFIFGWDDFIHPEELGIANPTHADLRDPRVSDHREIYRGMRQDSNSQFANRDRLIYLNIAMRVFSIFQVAYLEGLLTSGDSSNGLQIAGHRVSVIADCRGLTSTRVGAALSF